MLCDRPYTRQEALAAAARLEELLPLNAVGARKADPADPLHRNPYTAGLDSTGQIPGQLRLEGCE